jgi:hypothetical protein
LTEASWQYAANLVSCDSIRVNSLISRVVMSFWCVGVI